MASLIAEGYGSRISGAVTTTNFHVCAFESAVFRGALEGEVTCFFVVFYLTGKLTVV